MQTQRSEWQRALLAWTIGTLTATIAIPVYAADSVRILLRGFIPNSAPGFEAEFVPLPGDPSRTMLKAMTPKVHTLPNYTLMCFSTDNRGFSEKADASSRVVGDITLEVSKNISVAPTDPSKRYRAGQTSRYDCATGKVLDTGTATVSSCYVGTPAYADNLVQVVMTCKATDPIVKWIPSLLVPDMHFQGVFTYHVATRSIAFKGDVGSFPAFEAYASLNGSEFKRVFIRAPQQGNPTLLLLDLWQHIGNIKIDTLPVKL